MPIDGEALISHLSGSLDPDDRAAFRQHAEAALAAPNCWGDGLVHRVVVSIWQRYFHPPADTRGAQEALRGGSKLTQQPPLRLGRDRRFSRKIQINA